MDSNVAKLSCFVLLDSFVALLEQPFHGFAGLAFGWNSQRGENFFETRHMRLGFGEVARDRLGQFARRSSLRKLRQGFHELFFGVVKVLDLVS